MNCKNCVRLMVVNEREFVNSTCSLNNKIYPHNIYDCNFFKAKQKNNKKQKKANKAVSGEG